MRRDLSLSIWASIWAKKGNLLSCPWQDWVAALSTHYRREEKGGPCFSVAIIEEGNPRRGEFVQGADCLCLDIDEGSEEEIAEALQPFASYAYHLHSTHRHGLIARPDGTYQTKIRVLLPLARRVTREEQKRVWPVLSRMAHNVNDQKAKDPNRAYFLPSTPPNGPTPLILHNAVERWLDPDNLLQLAETEIPTTEQPTPTPRETRAEVDALANKLRRIGVGHEYHQAALALVHGKPFAKEGERHQKILELTGWLAYKTDHKPVSPESIEALFKPSLDIMRQLPCEGEPCEGPEAAVKAYETAITNAQAVKERERVEVQAQYAGPESPDWPPETIEKCAEAQKTAREKLAFIVTRDKAHYILQPDTYFAGPFVEKDAAIEIAQALSKSPIRLYEPKGKEGFRPRSFAEVMRQYGRVAERVVANLATQRTRYDRPHRTIHEAVCPLQDHTPNYDPKIDQWLRLFAATEHNYNKILDWMACAPDLNKLLCALTLAGAPGTGKTLFAQGVASLWAEGGAAASPEVILGNFNEDLVRCPLVFADETLPKTYRWESVTTKLRAEIASLVRTLNRKYYAPLTLQGSLRFILATNNPNILASNISTAADLTAVAVRFFYIETGAEAERYLLNLDHQTKDRWRTNGIASHTLWLRQNRAVEPAGRFWVTGDIERMHRLLVTSSDWNSWVCEWVVKGLLDGFRKAEHNQDTAGRVQIDDNCLYVNTNAITDGWELYTNYKNVNPDPRRVATALRSIATNPKPKQRRPTKLRYFEIDQNHLIAWAEEKGISGQAEIELAIAQGLTERPKVISLDEKRKDKDNTP